MCLGLLKPMQIWSSAPDGGKVEFFYVLVAYEDKLSISHMFEGARKRVELKDGLGRGRKIVGWVLWLYSLICDDFKRLKVVGQKFSPKVLMLVAKHVLQTTHIQSMAQRIP